MYLHFHCPRSFKVGEFGARDFDASLAQCSLILVCRSLILSSCTLSYDEVDSGTKDKDDGHHLTVAATCYW